MSQEHSVTQWINLLKVDDQVAAQHLWERYVDRLVRLAREKLGRTPRRAADEEDVVISAFDGFFRGVRAGRFSRLSDRDDLWQVLVVLTERKAMDQRRRELADKRGGGHVRGESAFQQAGSCASSHGGISQISAGEPDAEFAVQVAEEFDRLLHKLGDETLRNVALKKMNGHTNSEIADNLNMGLRSVERKLGVIRRILQEDRKT